MSVQAVSFSLSEPIDIYTDKYILTVPYLNMVHTLLSGVGDNIEADSNVFLSNTFRTMQYIIDNTDIDIDLSELMVIYNKTIRLKGQLDSVYYFFLALGITVSIEYNSADTSIIFAIIDFGDLHVQDIVAFEQGYTQLINELLFFGQGDFMYDHLEITYAFQKSTSTEITLCSTNMVNISQRRIIRKMQVDYLYFLVASNIDTTQFKARVAEYCRNIDVNNFTQGEFLSYISMVSDLTVTTIGTNKYIYQITQ